MKNSEIYRTTMDSILSFLDTTSLGILVSLVLISCFLVLRWSKVAENQRREAPMAAGGWPIIGHLLLINRSKIPPHETLGAMADKYGPIFTIRIGAKPALVICNWEMAKECFTTNDLVVSSRPRPGYIDKVWPDSEAFMGLAPYGPYWREVRKISTIEFLSNHRIKLLSRIRVSEVQTCIREILKLAPKKGKSQVLVDLKQCFNDLTLNMVLRSLAGKRFFGPEAMVGEKEAHRFQKAVREVQRLMGLFSVGDAIPLLRWLDLGGHEKAMREAAKELNTIVKGWIKEHRQRRALGDHVKEDQDFIDVMISILDGCELAGFDADTVNKATTLTLITGATDTNTVTLTWAMSLLLNNPHVLKKAQEELDSQVGKERLVKESDIDKLVYMQAIVKETLRLHPPGPLAAPREFTEDCTLGGYHISKGTRLITNLWKIQTDPSFWSDPLVFKPERFLTTNKDIDVRGNHFEYIPFGSGRRICPAISFALQMVHFTLASFLHSFEISKPDEPIDMSEDIGMTNIKATPLEVLVEPRLSPKLWKT